VCRPLAQPPSRQLLCLKVMRSDPTTFFALEALIGRLGFPIPYLNHSPLAVSRDTGPSMDDALEAQRILMGFLIPRLIFGLYSTDHPCIPDASNRDHTVALGAL
jgi:hypothetical protein